MKSATFFEALASAAANPGQKWHRQDDSVHCFVFVDVSMDDFSDLQLMDPNEPGGQFYVWGSDLTATWVCETEGKERTQK